MVILLSGIQELRKIYYKYIIIDTNYFMSVYLNWYEQKLGYPFFCVKITLMSIYLDWYFINDNNYFM